MFDVSFGRSTPTLSPKISDLTEKVMKDLIDLQSTTAVVVPEKEMTSTEESVTNGDVGGGEDVEMEDDSEEEESRKRSLRVAKSGN